MSKNIKNLFCIGLASLSVLGLFTGCSKQETSEAKDTKSLIYCSPTKYAWGKDVIEVVLAENGETIEQYTLKQHVTKAYLKKLQASDKKEGINETLKELFETSATNMRNQYYGWYEDTAKTPWVSGYFIADETDMTIDSVISFDFTSDKFFPDQDTLDFLYNYMPTEYFYDEDEQKFVYHDVIEGVYYDNNLNIECDAKTKTADETLHAKVVVKAKEYAKAMASSDSEDSDSTEESN